MILTISKVTDIINLYPDWLMQRFKDGYVDKKEGKLTRLDISPSVVDGIVFWTYNPHNFLPYLNEFMKYDYRGAYYFVFNYIPYDKYLKPNIDNLKAIKAAAELSKVVGAERVVWRYSPIIINSVLDLNDHVSLFKNAAKNLENRVTNCILGFPTNYMSLQSNKFVNAKKIEDPAFKTQIVETLSETAIQFGISTSCCGSIELSTETISPRPCIDALRLAELSKCQSDLKNKPGSRCVCDPYYDIGDRRACSLNCAFCYNPMDVRKINHSTCSTMLIGENENNNKYTKVKSKPCFRAQLSLFD